MAPSATGLVGVHGFDLARDAVVELQVLVCECVRSEVAQIVDSLRCVSEGAEHSGVNFPGFAVLTKALLNRTGLPALSTVELLIDRPVGGALWLSCLQATAPPAGAVSSEASFVLKMKIGFGIPRKFLR